MKIVEAGIEGLKILTPERFGDHRGFLSEVYSKKRFAEAGIDTDFVQDNHSLSRETGVVRALHFQMPPFGQAKLVRVVRGAIFDVAVDLRLGSPTFGRSASCVLSAENWQQFFIPVGFAHGFCTLEPDTEVLYKASAAYAPDYERGLLWNDPALKIEWPVSAATAILAERDRSWPRLEALADVFAPESAGDD